VILISFNEANIYIPAKIAFFGLIFAYILTFSPLRRRIAYWYPLALLFTLLVVIPFNFLFLNYDAVAFYPLYNPALLTFNFLRDMLPGMGYWP